MTKKTDKTKVEKEIRALTGQVGIRPPLPPEKMQKAVLASVKKANKTLATIVSQAKTALDDMEKTLCAEAQDGWSIEMGSLEQYDALGALCDAVNMRLSVKSRALVFDEDT